MSLPTLCLSLLLLPLLAATLPSYNRQFSDVDLQPTTPSTSIRSSYTLAEELSAWKTHAILAAIVEINRPLRRETNGNIPDLVFAPTDEAFAKIARILRPSATDVDIHVFSDIWFEFENKPSTELIPAAQDLISYHFVIGQDLTEQMIADAGSLKPLFGPDLNTTAYPIIRDVDNTNLSSRIGRQIQNTNGRLMFIDNLLIPFDFQQTIKDINPSRMLETDRQASLPLFEPLTSFTAFLSNRNDLSLLYNLVLLFPDTVLKPIQDAAAANTKLHLFAPTNKGVVDMLSLIVPTGILRSELPSEFEKSLFNNTLAEEAAKRMVDLWTHITVRNIPGLDDVLLYHVLGTDQSYTDLQGQGVQDTFYSGNQITISDSGIADTDPNREDALPITSFATTTGYVTVINSVLLPFDSSVITTLINNVVSPSATPSISQSPNHNAARSSPTEDPDFPSPSIAPSASKAASPSASVAASDVPSPSQVVDDPVCFPADAVVMTEGGKMSMKDLKAGHNVLVGDNEHSKIFLWTHRQHDVKHEFIRITTKSGHTISMTRGHYLYGNGHLVSAGSVRIGDRLETDSGMSVVRKVEKVEMEGLFAPHTMHGDMFVNGIRVSGYSTAVHPKLAHALLAPIRMFVKMTGVREPLGRLFYQGAPRLARFIPGGRNMH